MAQCKHYKVKTVEEPCFKITGEPYYEQRQIGVCTRKHGVEVYCHGNKTRCETDEQETKWR